MHIPAKGKAKRGDSYDIQRYWQFLVVVIVAAVAVVGTFFT